MYLHEDGSEFEPVRRYVLNNILKYYTSSELANYVELVHHLVDDYIENGTEKQCSFFTIEYDKINKNYPDYKRFAIYNGISILARPDEFQYITNHDSVFDIIEDLQINFYKKNPDFAIDILEKYGVEFYDESLYDMNPFSTSDYAKLLANSSLLDIDGDEPTYYDTLFDYLVWCDEDAYVGFQYDCTDLITNAAPW